LLQARLWGIYDQGDTSFIEKDPINLAIKWNRLESSTEVEKGRVQKVTEDTVYSVRKEVSGEGEDSPWQSISNKFLTRLQGLYGQDNTANKEKDFMKLAKDWNDSGSNDKGRDLRLRNEAVYPVG